MPDLNSLLRLNLWQYAHEIIPVFTAPKTRILLIKYEDFTYKFGAAEFRRWLATIPKKHVLKINPGAATFQTRSARSLSIELSDGNKSYSYTRLHNGAWYKCPRNKYGDELAALTLTVNAIMESYYA